VLCPDVSLFFVVFPKGGTSNLQEVYCSIPWHKAAPTLEENVAATEIALTPDDLRRLIAPQGVAAGDRYPTQHMNAVNR